MAQNLCHRFTTLFLQSNLRNPTELIGYVKGIDQSNPFFNTYSTSDKSGDILWPSLPIYNLYSLTSTRYLPLTNIEWKKQTDTGWLPWSVVYRRWNIDRLCIVVIIRLSISVIVVLLVSVPGGLPIFWPISIAIVIAAPSLIAAVIVLLIPSTMTIVMISKRRRYR